MTEISQEEPKKRKKNGSLRSPYRIQYEEARGEAGKTLAESGVDPNIEPFRKPFRIARHKFAKQKIVEGMEGEKDALTGLLNRKAFERRVRDEAERAPRIKSVLVEFDANGFKQINDKFGHNAGDETLKIIAQILKECSRKADIVARVGGDEFWVLLSPIDVEIGPQVFLDRVFKKFGEKREEWFLKDGIHISAGAAPLNPSDIKGSMENADKMMYEAKKRSIENNRNFFAISN